MTIDAARIDARLQVWKPGLRGWEPKRNQQLIYQSGQADPPEYLLMLSNHRFWLHGIANRASWTGRVGVEVDEVYWQDKIEAKEIANSDPQSFGMSTAVDVGWSALHGFKVESIAPGGERVIALRIVGTGLDFVSGLKLIRLVYPVVL